MILFKRALEFDTTPIKNQIEYLFLKEYLDYNIDIEEIYVELVSFYDISEYSLESVNFGSNLLKREHGTFSVTYRNGEKQRNIFFKYSISATVEALVATDSIQSRDELSRENVSLQRVKFSQLLSSPAKADILKGGYVSRSYLRSGQLISERNIIKLDLIKKGDKLFAIVNDGVVRVELEVVALESGNIGDIIKVRLPNRDTIEARVLEKSVVEIL